MVFSLNLELILSMDFISKISNKNKFILASKT